jgi:hypothetical protein
MRPLSISLGILCAVHGMHLIPCSPVVAQAAHATAGPVAEYDVVDDRQCRTCRLEVSAVVTLDVEHYPIRLGSGRFVSQDARGRFYAAGEDGGVGIFDAHGRFERTLAPIGDGPGEFRRASAVSFGSGDSVFVFDPVHRRITVFGPEPGRFVRTFGIAAAQSFLPRANGAVVSGAAGTGTSESKPIHRLDGAGRLKSSAGEPVDMKLPMHQRLLYRRFAPGNGFFLASPMSRYQIEVWSDQLALREVLRRRVSWFPDLPASASVDPPDVSPMPAQLFGLSTDFAANVVFSCVQYGSEESRASTRARLSNGRESHSRMPVPSTQNAFLESRIEAIDLRKRSVLAWVTHRGKLTPILAARPFAQGALFYVPKSTEDDDETVEIVRVQLRR